MKSKLKARFLPPTYVQDCYSQLHHLNQGNLSVEEYIREFEKLVINCDLQEPEEQTIVRYLGGLDPRYANVVELQAYTSFDEVCVLAHKVEQQKKSKPPSRHETPKSSPHEQTLNNGSSSYAPKPTESLSPSPQKNQTPQKGLSPQLTPKPLPKSIPRCYKCQGFIHLALDYTNRRYITLAEWKANEEVELEEKKEEDEGDDLEEIEIEADEGEMLTLDTYPHPPKGKENQSILFMTFGEPSTFFPPPPTPKALKLNFRQVHSKPLLTTPSLELRVSEEVVHDMFKESPRYNIQINKGHEEKRASKITGKLFER